MRPCPRCQESHVVDAAQAAEIASAAPMEPSLRAEDSVREQRLKHCAACAGLREEIICAYCGCFVQFRARIKHSFCPNPAGNKWET